MAVSKRFPLPPSDRYAHPHPWNSAIRPMLLHDLFAGQAQKMPDAPLVEFLGRTFSYRRLYSDARCFAAGLAARGIAKGDRVGLFLPNVPSYVAAYYGAMMAGAVVVNFSPLYTVEELSAQVVDSGARLLVTLDALIAACTRTIREELLPKIADGVYTWEDYVENDGVDESWGPRLDGTPRSQGRVTLNPLAPADPTFRPGLDQTFSSKWVTDLALSYRFFDQVGLTIGGNNIFDAYPDTVITANQTRGIYEYAGQTPFGFNGAYYYVRASLDLRSVPRPFRRSARAMAKRED